MDSIILFRIAERLTLTAVVILVALVVMIGFWRTIQKINISQNEHFGLAGSVAFSTPVFVLLAIIGYAWVSLEHPIQVGQVTPDEASIQATAGQEAATLTTGNFVGSSRTATGTNTGYDAAITQRRLRSVNCALRGKDLGQRTSDDIAEIKLTLIRDLWQDDWGDPVTFADWVRTGGTPAPNDLVLEVWEEVHPLC